MPTMKDTLDIISKLTVAEFVKVLIMKNRKITISTCVLIAIVVIALFIYPREIGKKPFAELKAEDISSATVQLLPPNKTVQVTDIKELVAGLNEVVVYSKDDSYKEYSGQAVIYTITFSDGKEMVVNAYNPFMIIDGVGYKTKYEPCERLSQIANDLAK